MNQAKIDQACDILKDMQRKLSPNTVQGKYFRMELANALRLVLEGSKE